LQRKTLRGPPPQNRGTSGSIAGASINAKTPWSVNHAFRRRIIVPVAQLKAESDRLLVL